MPSHTVKNRFFLALTLCIAPLAAQADECPANALNIVGSLNCSCPANAQNAPIWGTNVYTGDSNICTAARHSGVIGGTGGDISLSMVAGQGDYPSSTANGITSGQWGQFNESFTVLAGTPAVIAACGTMPTGAQVHVCSCAPGASAGSVWGSDPYTGDSNLCAAAQHSGVITAAGGQIRALGVAGLSSYRGSPWNGVDTMDYGQYSNSVTFDRN